MVTRIELVLAEFHAPTRHRLGKWGAFDRADPSVALRDTFVMRCAKLWALSPVVISLLVLVPIGYILPRRPAVPNGMVVQKASSNSRHWPPAICFRTSGR